MPGRKWTAQKRKAQAEAIRRSRPWEKSTGPKTPEGKAKASQNALKHGVRSKVVKDYRRIVRENRRFNLFDIAEQQKIEAARETAIHFVASLRDKKDVDALLTGQEFIATQTRKTTRNYWKFHNRLAEFVRWDTYSLRSPRIK